jgi:hypothetical protein
MNVRVLRFKICEATGRCNHKLPGGEDCKHWEKHQETWGCNNTCDCDELFEDGNYPTCIEFKEGKA